jgi:hypothetical protein
VADAFMDEIESISDDALVVCACDGKEYTTRDVVDAALFRGELEPNWNGFLINLTAQTRAEELELEIDRDAIDAAAESFRYEHDLITAEETERWLAARGLSLEDFTDYVTRQYWGSSLEEKIEPEDVDFVSAPPKLHDLFTADLIFSGELDRLITGLTWRLAALAAKENDAESAKIDAERRTFLGRTKSAKSNLSDWLAQIGRGEKWLEEMLTMEVAYRSLCEKLLTSEARKKQLSMLRMPLTQFEAEVIEVESTDAAKEALLCIREDGMSLEEVAAEARYPYRQIHFLHQEIPEQLQQKFWSARTGDVLEPLPRGDGFELYRITKKAEPEAGDPEVQRRIDQRLLEQHFSALTTEYVELRLGAPS